MKKFLKEKECAYLKSSHRQEKNGRMRDRIKAILMADSGWTYKKNWGGFIIRP